MAESFIQLPTDGVGKKLRSYDKVTNGMDQYVIPTTEKAITWTGSVATFRTPGRAGTTGQKIFAIFNATGSTVFVNVRRISISLTATVVKAVTVLPPTVRIMRTTTLPTNGTAGTVVPTDTAFSLNGSITTYGDASADGTSSVSALTVTTTNTVEEQFPARLLTGATQDLSAPMEFVSSSPLMLRALQGITVFLDYTLATQNPTTDMWATTCWFDQYTLP